MGNESSIFAICSPSIRISHRVCHNLSYVWAIPAIAEKAAGRGVLRRPSRGRRLEAALQHRTYPACPSCPPASEGTPSRIVIDALGFRHTFSTLIKSWGGRESCARAAATRIVQNDDGWVHGGSRTAETPSARTTCASNHAHGNSWSRMIVVECCGKNCPDAVKSLILWRPRRDLNPCYRRERAMS